MGRAIKAARLAKGMSQEELALHAEVDPSYLGRVERGDNNAALLTLLRIARALETTLARLVQKAGL
jgi:transcriptional regulator with XRE-family HTH domain